MTAEKRHIDIEGMSPDERALADVLALAVEAMPTQAKSAQRRLVLADVRARRGSAVRRLAVRAATLGVAATTIFGGVSYAAAGALPGEPLYPVKLGIERVVVALLPDGALQDDFLTMIAERRAAEAGALVLGGASGEVVDEAVIAFGDAAEEAIRTQESRPDQGATAEERIREQVQEAPDSVQPALEDALRSRSQEPQVDPTQGPNGSDSGSGSSGAPPSESGDGASSAGSDPKTQ